MWSMWNAPSDRDYYGYDEEPEPDDRCFDCGASDVQPCEEHCMTNRAAEEPAVTDEAEQIAAKEIA